MLCPPLRLLLALLGGLTLLSTAPGALALKDDDKQPMLIEADKVEVDEGKQISLYLGRVQVDQGSMRLEADQVTVHHHPDRRIRYIIARGEPARFKQQMDADDGEVRAFAKRMDYDADKDELVLTDEALLLQGTDRISGNRIVYDRARARMLAGGDGRVQIRITPDAQDNRSKAGPPKPAPGTGAGPARP